MGGCLRGFGRFQWLAMLRRTGIGMIRAGEMYVHTPVKVFTCGIALFQHLQ